MIHLPFPNLNTPVATKEMLQGSGDYSSVSAYTWDIIAYSGQLVKSKVKKDEKIIFKNDAKNC